MTKFYFTTYLCAILALFCGCSSRNQAASSLPSPFTKIGRIEVSVAEFADEREDRASKIDLDGQIKERTQNLLVKRNLFDTASPNTLRIHLTSFRLRHGATRFFTGIFSGSDHLKGTVSIDKSSTKVLQEEIEISGGNGNPFAISSSSRGANLSNDFAQRIVKIIETKPLLQFNVAATAIPSGTPEIVISENNRKEAKLDSPSSRKLSTCSTDQILTMKNVGFNDEKIKAACGS
jgi:hypothetical protein